VVRRILAVSVLAFLATPGAAHAVTQVRTEMIQGQNVVVAVDEDSGATINTALDVDPTDGPFVAVQNPAGATLGDADCQTVSATVVACLGTFDAIVVFGNGGNDTITMDLFDDGVDPLHGEAYGDAGNDTLTATRAPASVAQPETYMEGGPGNDRMTSGRGPDELHGDDGNDTISSTEGEDSVFGEGGDDSVSAGKEDPEPDVADVVDGGPGFDSIPTASSDYNRGTTDDVAVTNDGVANDGEPGEGDNVTSVEKLYVVGAAVTVGGTNGSDDIFVDADSSTIRGLGGDDKLVAYDGNDTIEGGDGNDFLEGGFGNDVLDGGAGVDQFRGDRIESNVIAVGADQIRARDGNAEQIDCGIGPDTAQVDASDLVVGCESVDRPPPPLVLDGVVVNLAPGRPAVLGKLSIKRIASKGLAIRVRCPAACTVVAELRASKALARKLKLGRSRLLARGRKTLRAAGNAKVTLKVVREARKRFKRLRKAKVTLVTRTTVAGKTTRATRTLKLKR